MEEIFGLRKKAEQQIRKATTILGGAGFFRIDTVRAYCSLLPKVYDKTILDMARVGTIELIRAQPDDDPESGAGLIRRGDTVFEFFRFTDGSDIQNLEGTIDIVWHKVPRELWQRFENRCLKTEVKTPFEKVLELIRDYLENE